MVKVEIIDLEKVLAILVDLPEEIADRAVEDVNTYMLNIEHAYPPYKYVPYKRAYGGWASEKQRRFVMAAIADGRITPGKPSRTQTYSKAWRKVGTGRNQYLENKTPYGLYLQSEDQARMPAMIGWEKISDQLENKAPRIMEIIDAAVKKVLKRRGAV